MDFDVWSANFDRVGFVSMLSLSEYRYIKGAGINPNIAKEGMKHIKYGGESKKFGITLGLSA